MHGSTQSVGSTLVPRTLHARFAVALSGITALATFAGWHPSSMSTLLIMSIAVALGMPHGALDVAIGPKLTHWALFFPMYAIAFGTAVAAWFVQPLIGLVVFLLISWFHFGAGDTAGFDFSSHLQVARAIATGGLVLSLPLATHAETVHPIFQALLFGRVSLSVETVQLWGFVALAVALPAALVTMVAHVRSHQWIGLAELICLLALGTFATPLISFSMYFAVWHGPRHMMATQVNKKMLIPAVVASVATVTVGLLTWMFVEPSFVVAVRVVFIGLAALTIPHLVVTLLAPRRLPDCRSSNGTNDVVH